MNKLVANRHQSRQLKSLETRADRSAYRRREKKKCGTAKCRANRECHLRLLPTRRAPHSALFLLARRSTLINEFIGNSRRSRCRSCRVTTLRGGKRLGGELIYISGGCCAVDVGPRRRVLDEATHSVTPRHFNFAKKLSNYELF